MRESYSSPFSDCLILEGGAGWGNILNSLGPPAPAGINL